MKEKVKDFALVTTGSLIAALGFNTMFLENNIVSGGIGGLAIALKALVGWNPSNFVLWINIPLMILCFVFLGKQTFVKTVYGSWIYPIFIKLTDGLPTLTDDPFLAAVFGGIILGFGLGLVFFGNASTGGTSIIIQIIKKYTPLPLALVMGLIDGIVVGLGFFAFDTDTVLHSIIALVTISYVVNLMMTGVQSSRNMMIISHKHQEIKHYVTTVADRGLTELPVLGGFTGEDKRMLMITISRQELQRIQHQILHIDSTAFIVVMPASHVMGRGFSLHKYHQHPEEDILMPM